MEPYYSGRIPFRTPGESLLRFRENFTQDYKRNSGRTLQTILGVSFKILGESPLRILDQILHIHLEKLISGVTEWHLFSKSQSLQKLKYLRLSYYFRNTSHRICKTKSFEMFVMFSKLFLSNQLVLFVQIFPVY